MLISPAYAQGAGLMDQSALVQFLPLMGLIFVVVLLPVDPAAAEEAEGAPHDAEADRRGDRVVTGGGILGTVSKVRQPR